MSGPDVWGPHGWKFIHFVTLGYPNNPSKEQKKTYKTFFETLKTIIPCSICATHYTEHLKKFPLDNNVLSNKQELIEWGINVHNAVNKTHNKKIYGFKDGLAEIIKNSDPIYVQDKDKDLDCNCPITNTKKSIKSSLAFVCILSFLIIFYFVIKKK